MKNNETEIINFLLNKANFENIETDKWDAYSFSCMKRIDAVHYLFWSEKYKYFSLGVKLDHPKGKNIFWQTIMIPKLIKTKEEAINLINAVSNENLIAE